MKLFKIILGSGTPGKLWTGTQDLDQFRSRIAEVRIFRYECKCGATTRKLVLSHPLFAQEGIESLLTLPTLFISTGGVGSLGFVSPPLSKEEVLQITFWNWSGRDGGYAIPDPLLVCSGAGINQADLPDVEEEVGVWIHPYHGSTLDDWCLVGDINHHRELLPEDICLKRQCPKCRESNRRITVGGQTLVFSEGFYENQAGEKKTGLKLSPWDFQGLDPKETQALLLKCKEFGILLEPALESQRGQVEEFVSLVQEGFFHRLGIPVDAFPPTNCIYFGEGKFWVGNGPEETQVWSNWPLLQGFKEDSQKAVWEMMEKYHIEIVRE